MLHCTRTWCTLDPSLPSISCLQLVISSLVDAKLVDWERVSQRPGYCAQKQTQLLSATNIGTHYVCNSGISRGDSPHPPFQQRDLTPPPTTPQSPLTCSAITI